MFNDYIIRYSIERESRLINRVYHNAVRLTFESAPKEGELRDLFLKLAAETVLKTEGIAVDSTQINMSGVSLVYSSPADVQSDPRTIYVKAAPFVVGFNLGLILYYFFQHLF